MGSLRIYISTTRSGARGPLYDARLNGIDGDILVTGSTEPLFDAARVLHAQGVEGHLEMWDPATPYPRMRGLIANLARLSVREGNEDGPRFCRFKEHPEVALASARKRVRPPTCLKTGNARPCETPAAANGILETRAA